MFAIFLSHQWKSYWRSKSKGTNLAARIILLLLVAYFLAISLFLGFALENILRQFFGDGSLIYAFNGILLYYFFADLIIRIQLQELPTMAVVPYLHLNIRRNTIVRFLNVKSLFHFLNLLPIVVFAPFCFLFIGKELGNATSWFYLLAIISWALFNNFLILFFKRKSISNIAYSLIGFAILVAIAALEYFKFFSVFELGKFFFSSILSMPWLIGIFPLLAMTIIVINSLYLRRNLYIEEIGKGTSVKTSTAYPLLNKFGRVGELAALELKLILRHKRSRSAFFLGFLFLFYGLLFYKQPLLEKDEFATMLFAALFMTGISILMYGQYMFGWQSGHFDGILVNKIDFTDFIKAKFLLFTIGSTIITILSVLYAFISWKLLLLHFAAYLYNIGFGTVIVLFFATRNYKSLDLSKGASFNWQGTGAVQWIMSIPLLVLPYIIYVPFGIYDMPYWGLVAIGLFGLIALLLRPFWIKKITTALIKNKYKIAEGFRE